MMRSLAGNLLVAMPNLDDDLFTQSVIYLYKHDDEGAEGFIINKTLNVKAKELLALEDLTINVNNLMVLAGGPVEPDHLLALYREIPSTKTSQSFILSERELANLPLDNINHNLNLFLGYSRWQPEQLEYELKHSFWLVAPGCDKIVYDIPPPYRYKICLQSIGVDLLKLIPGVVGHA